MSEPVTVVCGTEISSVVARAGSTVGDVLDALQMDSDGYQVKIGNRKVSISASVNPGDVVVLVPHVVAG
jgi:hypothetical protein